MKKLIFFPILFFAGYVTGAVIELKKFIVSMVEQDAG